MYFEIYKDAKGEYRWRLKAANHEIIAQGEGYTSKQNCLNAVNLVKSTNSATTVNDLTAV